MTGPAFALVLCAAFLHASWNYLAKRAGGGTAFIWLMSAWSALIYCPIALLVNYSDILAMSPAQWSLAAGSSAIHLVYFIVLQRAYRIGDLSLIYPLARGTGPTLSTLIAILVLAERPTWPALLGAGLVIAGVVLLSRGSGGVRRRNLRLSVMFGLLTGCFIAGYTIWDKYSVGVMLVPPLVMEGFSFIFRLVFTTPHVLRNRDRVARVWRENRREVLGVALVGPLAYIMVLIAMTFTPVSYVAPLREVSVLFAVIMGARLLREGAIKARLAAATVIAVGVALMALN